ALLAELVVHRQVRRRVRVRFADLRRHRHAAIHVVTAPSEWRIVRGSADNARARHDAMSTKLAARAPDTVGQFRNALSVPDLSRSASRSPAVASSIIFCATRTLKSLGEADIPSATSTPPSASTMLSTTSGSNCP